MTDLTDKEKTQLGLTIDLPWREATEDQMCDREYVIHMFKYLHDFYEVYGDVGIDLFQRMLVGAVKRCPDNSTFRFTGFGWGWDTIDELKCYGAEQSKFSRGSFVNERIESDGRTPKKTCWLG